MPATAALLQRTADALADDGAKVEHVKSPVDSGEQLGLFFQMVGAAVSPSMDDVSAESLGSHRSWLRLEERRAAVRDARGRAWFEDWDVLLCPVTPSGALPHDQEHGLFERAFSVNGVERPFTDNLFWTGMIGILGLPSAVPPIGRTPEGLPVGVQVVAPLYRDRTAIAVARMIAEHTGGYEPPPGF